MIRFLSAFERRKGKENETEKKEEVQVDEFLIVDLNSEHEKLPTFAAQTTLVDHLTWEVCPNLSLEHKFGESLFSSGKPNFKIAASIHANQTNNFLS